MRILDRGIVNSGVAGGPLALSIFPSVTPLSDGSILASYRTGSTKDSDDEDVAFRWSFDNAASWSEPIRPFSNIVDGKRGSVRVAYITPIAGRHLLATVNWVDRETYPGQPLFNPGTEGCLPLKILVADSHDLGRTWSPLRQVPAPDGFGPPSLSNGALYLDSKRLAISIESNKHYLDASPWMQNVVCVCSSDLGRTWDEVRPVSQDPEGRIFNWDQRAAVAPDGRIAAFSWTYDRATTTYLNVHRRISSNEGLTWAGPDDLGFADQPSHPAILPDGRVVLAWVDRYGSRSIKARLADAVNAPFTPESELVVYQSQTHAIRAKNDAEMIADMGLWTFGLPYAETLPNGDVLVVYYAGAPDAMSIHWVRLEV